MLLNSKKHRILDHIKKTLGVNSKIPIQRSTPSAAATWKLAGLNTPTVTRLFTLLLVLLTWCFGFCDRLQHSSSSSSRRSDRESRGGVGPAAGGAKNRRVLLKSQEGIRQQQRSAAQPTRHSNVACSDRSCRCARSGSPCNLLHQDIFTKDGISHPRIQCLTEEKESDRTENTLSLSSACKPHQ